MLRNKRRSSEQEIAFAVLAYLANHPTGEASVSEIKMNLPNFISLTEEDTVQSPTRVNEKIWEQQVRNIVSHRSSPDSFIYDGLLTYTPRHLAITDIGRKFFQLRSVPHEKWPDFN